MGKLPAFLFYPKDWLSDPAVRACSLQARGLWTDVLCLMWESPDRGVLKTGDKPWDAQEIAAAVGADATLVAKLLDELRSKGVSTHREDGTIICRRMIREEDRRASNRESYQRHNVPKPFEQHSDAIRTPFGRHSSSASSSSKQEEQRAEPARTLLPLQQDWENRKAEREQQKANEELQANRQATKKARKVPFRNRRSPKYEQGGVKNFTRKEPEGERDRKQSVSERAIASAIRRVQQIPR